MCTMLETEYALYICGIIQIYFYALRVHASTAAAYSDKYSGRSYIASDLDVSLGDVQNDMTGAHGSCWFKYFNLG